MVVVIDMVDIDLHAMVLLHKPRGIFDDRQGTESQEVHLQQTKFLDRRHDELRGDRAVRGSRKRYILVHRLLGDHDTRRMHGRVARQTLQPSGHIDQSVHILIGFIHALKLRVHLQCLVNRDIQLVRDHLRDRVAEAVRKVHDPSHIADDTFCCQCAERDNLGYTVLAVFFHDILNDFPTSLVAEVDINIRHCHSLRVQETLK